MDEGQGQRSRLGLELGSQFETRSVGPRSLIEDSFPVFSSKRDPSRYVDRLSGLICPLVRNSLIYTDLEKTADVQ